MSLKRFLLLALGLLVCALGAASAYYLFSDPFSKAKAVNGQMADRKINIAIMGVDKRDGDVGRSDTLMVMTVDLKNQSASLLSVPRDTRIKIPGHGYDKINHAYAEGGHRLTEQTLADFLGVSIDYYVLIDFGSFKKIIDSVGGVDIDVEKRMHYEDPYDNLVIDLQPGKQHLDSNTAIQYVRYRDEEGDIGRVNRQQKFIQAMLKQVTSPMTLPKIPSILSDISSAVQTDLSMRDMMSLAKLLSSIKEKGLAAHMVEGTPAYIRDISYWLPDVVKVRQYMASVMGIAMNTQYLAQAQSTANEYRQTVPKEMKIVELPKKPDAPKAPDLNASKNLADSNKVNVVIINGPNGTNTHKTEDRSENGTIPPPPAINSHTRQKTGE